ncbi:MAG: XRE family transcriptional regulator [Bacteroidales bacterium]|jgi:putative transcriptional regulator|nr:XRE family transcriptional regulator [Bacteroidales bacterium]MDD2205012.1 XRE family transcriptional regulator [Bacteroidales bacterium]MDD3153192.1 XRE family transcriptional regulator [Bacteroidales bacterium]MDD3914490.1 XRE family transcriptional regulator [Bacteroidales bacterium]MDD4634411.1 XRE family transcriptional regulator [Bacteroidales bacterium]
MKCQNTKAQINVIQKIKYLRIEHNISQIALSDILEISSGQVGSIESPRFQHKYTLKQIKKFCSHINYPFEQIFLDEIEIESPNYTDLLIQKIIEYDE